MISEKKRIANRANSKKSTGPCTPEGKRIARQNSTTHGLFCSSLLLPHDDPILFHTLRDSYLLALKPQNLPELQLVDQIVSAVWRLRRVQDAEELLHVHARQDYVTHQSLKNDPDSDPVSAIASSQSYFYDPLSHQLDRLAKHEQRYQRTIHRCYRELRLLRKDKLEELPTCPYFDHPEDVFHLNPHDIPSDPDSWPDFNDSYYDPYLTPEQKEKLKQEQEEEEQNEETEQNQATDQPEKVEIDQNEATQDESPTPTSKQTKDSSACPPLLSPVPRPLSPKNDQNEPTPPSFSIENQKSKIENRHPSLTLD